MTLSPPIRIAALVGVAAALALGAMFMLMGRSSTDSVAAPVHIVHHPFGPGVKAKPASAKSSPATGVKSAAKPTVVHAKVAAKAAAQGVPAVHRAPERPAVEVAALAAGLPLSLARALAQHSIVVVELTNPQSEVDGIAFAEARAGAAAAGAGFVPLNVLSQADVGKLTEHFGQVLPDPGLLVYKRPSNLVIRIDGFVDKDTVAQAAHNALVGA